MAKAEIKKSSRILTFDLLRGYFLVAILLDHLNFYPSGLDWVTMRGNMYVSAAEGFFLISGIVLGIVRGAKLIDQPLQRVARLFLKRGAQLYLTSIILAALFTLIGWWFYMDYPGLKFGIMPPNTNLFEAVWKLVTFQYLYGWADYLRLYCLFLLFSPLAMWLLRRGWWYIVLAASIGVWLLFPRDPTLPDAIQEYWQPLAWQLIFFSGLTIGFYWPKIVTWWQNLSAGLKRGLTVSVVSLAVVTLAINIFIVFGAKMLLPVPADLAHQLDTFGTTLNRDFFDKEALPIARIALFAVWFAASFWLFHRFEKTVMRFLGWLLLPFGQNSLYVYTISAVLLFFAHLYFVASTDWLPNLIISIVGILLIRLAIHYRVLMNIIPR